MKKVIFVVLLSVTLFTYCSKEEPVSSVITNESTLTNSPSTIVEYVNENYPDADINSIIESTNNSNVLYTVVLSTYEQLTFDANYGLVATLKSLCDSISSDTTSADSTGRHHGHHGGRHGGHHGNGGSHGSDHIWINVDSLPATVSAYVTANYSGFSIHNANYDTLCQFGTVLNVMIDSSKAAHHKLIFDTTGNFLALAHRVDSASVPTAVLSTIESTYPDYSLRKRAEQLTFDDGSLQYRMFLHQDTIKLCVALYADGTVICEQ